jgi:hypothetical protein
MMAYYYCYCYCYCYCYYYTLSCHRAWTACSWMWLRSSVAKSL